MSQNTDEDHQEVQTHMTVVYSKGVLGVAWYDSICGEVRCKHGLARIRTSPNRAAYADLATSCLQLNVLQANEESSGPFAFQFLHLAKLRAAPQARLVSAVLSFVKQDAAFVSGSPVCTTLTARLQDAYVCDSGTGGLCQR